MCPSWSPAPRLKHSQTCYETVFWRAFCGGVPLFLPPPKTGRGWVGGWGRIRLSLPSPPVAGWLFVAGAAALSHLLLCRAAPWLCRPPARSLRSRWAPSWPAAAPRTCSSAARWGTDQREASRRHEQALAGWPGWSWLPQSNPCGPGGSGCSHPARRPACSRLPQGRRLASVARFCASPPSGNLHISHDAPLCGVTERELNT